MFFRMNEAQIGFIGELLQHGNLIDNHNLRTSQKLLFLKCLLSKDFKLEHGSLTHKAQNTRLNEQNEGIGKQYCLRVVEPNGQLAHLSGSKSTRGNWDKLGAS